MSANILEIMRYIFKIKVGTFEKHILDSLLFYVYCIYLTVLWSYDKIEFGINIWYV